MIRRFFWFLIGLITGAWLLFYLRDKVRAMVEQATPAPLRRFTGRGVTSQGSQPKAARALGRSLAEARVGVRGRVSDFIDDVRSAAAEREAELRKELDLPAEPA